MFILESRAQCFRKVRCTGATFRKPALPLSPSLGISIFLRGVQCRSKPTARCSCRRSSLQSSVMLKLKSRLCERIWKTCVQANSEACNQFSALQLRCQLGVLALRHSWIPTKSTALSRCAMVKPSVHQVLHRRQLISNLQVRESLFEVAASKPALVQPSVAAYVSCYIF